MTWDQIEGNWKDYSGNIKEKWEKLTDEDLTAIDGEREQLVGKLQEHYCMAEDQAEKQIDKFLRSLPANDGETEQRLHGSAG